MSVHPALERTDHRPWPLPAGRWAWRQSWRDLLFAHWPVPVRALEALVPPGLTVQSYDGTGWLGVVPFRMTGVALRPLPDLPWISAFPELNVRTYVERDGKPGVWFFSLDAANALAVWMARRFFHLPYHRAAMSVDEVDGWIHYDSVRRSRRGRGRGGDAPGPAFTARYAPTSAPYEAEAGTLERWLTERYCLYASAGGGRLLRTEIHHRPWPLRSARAEIERNELCDRLGSLGPSCDAPPALLHFSRRIDVAVWPPEEVGTDG